MTHHGEALGRESGRASLAEAVASGDLDSLPPRMRALCRYAVDLARYPSGLSRAALDSLRAAGFDDRAIVDANQVVSYFSYVNRVALGLGVELESRWAESAARTESHGLAWRPGSIPQVAAARVPWVTVAQMREVDRIVVNEIGLSLARMMENAGSNMAELVRHELSGDVSGRRIAVLAGPGGNGGGGLAAGRHLANAGAEVSLTVAAGAGELSSATAEQLTILRRMGVAIAEDRAPTPEPEVVVDALLGYGQSGAPRGAIAELVRWTRGRRVISLDVPSGLELQSGQAHEPHVRAEATLALALPKTALRDHVGGCAGSLYLADIGVPLSLHRRLRLDDRPIFSRSAIVRVVP